ncbi:MAG TPA: DUF4365 domain-containing protein, partial [Sphingomonas sp.]|nr:DUF4365 domain-containing protein [Sphingomonas sp.]
MSRRPRSHQVEDISGRRFEHRLPVAWVSRAVSPDYGVDREVEIFTSGGDATGLKFAVQLKATDQAESGETVTLKVSLLDYLLNYDLPAIVVRYDATTDILRWQWASLISARASLKPKQRTFTHRFEAGDVWDDDTPGKIERALQARRALQQFPPRQAMPIRLEIDRSISHAAYVIERAVRAIIAESGGTLVKLHGERAPVELAIRVRDNFLSVDFDMLGSATFDLDSSDSAQLSSAILYAMAFLFARQRLGAHAQAAGRAILAGKHVAGNVEMVARASLAFAHAPFEQAELAILNSLHAADSIHFPMVVSKLIAAERHSSDNAAVNHFYTAALTTAQGDPARAASIHYSTANALRATQPRRAVFHYNRARRLRPSYLQADYFLSEFAGTLFHTRRYRCAVEFYKRAVALAPNCRLQLCLGDALLFSGDPASAAERFNLASESQVAQIVEEAVIKLELCHMLVAAHGAQIPVDWSRPMDDAPRDADARTAWIGHLSTVNALDPLAHFNLGVSDADLDDYSSALGHFVACAIVQTLDVEAWANAIISALRCNETALAITLLHLAIQHAGLDAYDALRKNLTSNGGDPDLLAQLDRIAFDAHARPDPTSNHGVTLRILDGDDAVVIGHA